MKRLLVIGASGGIGLAIVERALETGWKVRAMARGAERIGVEHPALEKRTGDALAPEDVAAALADVDVVAQSLGVKLDSDAVLRPVSLFSEATAILLAAMEAAGPRRLIAVTGFGAGDSRDKISFLESAPYRLLLGRVYDDKSRQEELIRRSALDWTILRPTILTNGPRRGRYQVLVEPASWRNGLISRADVADFAVRIAASGEHARQTPVLAY